MSLQFRALAALCTFGIASQAIAVPFVENYEGLSEDFYGTSWTHNGLTYRDVNDQPGSFPSGETFTASDPNTFAGMGPYLMIENATLLYNDFPDFGSPVNALTFGYSFVQGNNLSIGALSTAWVDLPTAADSASFEIVYYENGPWGGIVYHLDALLGNTVVASDTFTIADGGGRDNIAFNELAVTGATFDTLHVYATWGPGYSGPRGMIDNLTLNFVPEPTSLGFLGASAVLMRRRRA